MVAITAAATAAAWIGVTPVSATTQAKPTRPAYGTIWVLNTNAEPSGSIIELAPNANGDVAPISSIEGLDTGLTEPDDLVVTPSGALWVTQSSSNAVTEYAPGAHGDVGPIATLSGTKTGLDVPTSIAIAGDGSLWVMNAGQTHQTLSHFAAGAHGNVAPIATISGSNAGLVQTRGIALTPDGKHVWVNISGDRPAVKEFATNQHGNVAPLRTISGSNTMLGSTPYGVAVNSAGAVIVSCDDPAAILTFAANANGNVAPQRTIKGSATHVTSPSFLALDAIGNIWTENYSANSVVRFAPSADGNVAPSRLITGSKTQLGYPNAIAVYAAAPGAPRAVTADAQSHHRVTLHWKAPRRDGGGVISYAAYLMTSSHGKWAAVGSATGHSLTIAHVAAKKSYRVAVAAVNNAGSSPKSDPVAIS